MVLVSQSHLLRRQVASSHKLLSLIKRKPFSSLSQPQTQTPPPSDPQSPKPTSLSARMSFVFDQIDAIERDRQEKDQTLQRIRAWRQSKSINNNHPAELTNADSPEATNNVEKNDENGNLLLSKKQVELAHPWPEWLELMERLVQQNYFDHKRKDEDKLIEDMGFNVSEAAEEQGFDFTRDARTVQEAVLNFGRDRFDILRSLSRQDLQVLVGYGCPSTDKRVTFSAKVLRKHVHLDEGDVCSSCSLRSSCERAYLLTNKEDEARTIDVMRVLLMYGFDPINGSVVNKPLLKIKSVKTVVRKLLHEVVKLSAVPIDPNLPPPIFKKPPPKVKQPPPPPKKRVGRDDIEMKKGDWLCPKCDFMNFAKNTVCLQCDAKRPKRQLLPGEWECLQCNFLNYRRNMVCFHCESNRPPDEFTENKMPERQHGPRMRFEKASGRPEVNNAWNFDFDDDESDGADVAAFEYADSGKIDEDFPLAKQAQGEVSRGYEDGFNKGRVTRTYDRDYSGSRPMKPGMGFNDFDDEDDDVDNYEVDTQNEAQRTSRIDFSDLEDNSDSDDLERTDNSGPAHRQTTLREGKNPSRTGRRKEEFSGKDEHIDFGSDDDLPIHPDWKSSHVANPKRMPRHGGSSNFGSDDELGFSSGADESGDEDFRSKPNRGNKSSSNSRGMERRGGGRTQRFPDSESDDDRGSHRGKGTGVESRRNASMGRAPRGGGVRTQRYSDSESDDDRSYHRGKGTGVESRRNGSMGRAPRGGGRNSFKNDFDGSSRQSRGNSRDTGEYTYDRQKSKARDGDSRCFGASRGRGSYNQQRGRSNNDDNRSDSYYDDERFSKPRNNVR